VVWAQVRNNSFDGYAGVDGPKLAFRGDGLGQRVPRVGFIEKRLPLEVRRFYKVPVNDAEPPESGSHQELSCGRAYGATAHDHRLGSKKPPLALFADACEEHLPRVFFTQRVVHVRMRRRNAFRLLLLMIAPKPARQATPLCYASSERNGS